MVFVNNRTVFLSRLDTRVTGRRYRAHSFPHGLQPLAPCSYDVCGLGIADPVGNDRDHALVVVITAVRLRRAGELAQPEQVHNVGDVDTDVYEPRTKPRVQVLFGELGRDCITEDVVGVAEGDDFKLAQQSVVIAWTAGPAVAARGFSLRAS